jgi:protein phosphatase
MENKIAILLIGAPGSGKSTWGKHYVDTHTNFVRICPDEYRAKFGKGEDDQTVSGIAFAATKSAMANMLDAGKSVIIDATNMYPKTRKDFIKIAKEKSANTMAIVFEATKSDLIERNMNRGKSGGRNVPEHVIDSMLSKYQRPVKTEFDVIQYITKL